MIMPNKGEKMSKTLKWILGIVLVLVLVGAMFAVGFAWRTHTTGGWMMPYGYERNWNNPMMERGFNNWQHPMMTDRGFLPFSGFFFLGGLLKWVLFFGLLYGAYWLGRRNARFTVDPRPASPVDAPAPSKTPEQDS
jgi:hypothetical protein